MFSFASAVVSKPGILSIFCLFLRRLPNPGKGLSYLNHDQGRLGEDLAGGIFGDALKAKAQLTFGRISVTRLGETMTLGLF
jgi:hypothetical protein